MEKKPIIGICPLWDEERDSYWMLPGYMDGIMEAGGIPIVLPFTEDEDSIESLAALCDGLLFTGGPDVLPETYGMTQEFDNVFCCPKRDALELALLRLALAKDKPVLGICRGIQFLNGALGGTLYQDLPRQLPSGVDHRQKPPYDEPIHPVSLVAGSPLSELLGQDRILVNSCHHQAVRELSPRLKPMAIADDSIVEALYMPGKRFVWAVQWHPEFSHRKDLNSKMIFRAFVSSAKQ